MSKHCLTFARAPCSVTNTAELILVNSWKLTKKNFEFIIDAWYICCPRLISRSKTNWESLTFININYFHQLLRAKVDRKVVGSSLEGDVAFLQTH